MTAHELLIAARSLIVKPEHWTNSAHARDARGRTVLLGVREAVRFCADGALWRACGANANLRSEAAEALNHIAVKSGCRNYIDLNDAPDTSHADVIAMFDRAISATKDAVT